MVGYISKIKHQQDVDCNQVQQKAFAALDCGPFALAHAHGPQICCITGVYYFFLLRPNKT